MADRCRIVSLTIALLLICSIALGAQSLPSQLSDKEFWKMISDFSEPNGYYRYENFVSNEDDFQNFLPELTRTFKAGSIYVGVGPEQNFTYIAALKPKLAFVVDIRRQNMLELLLYKALFELSTNRADFVSKLFSRKATKNLAATSSPLELMEAFDRIPGDTNLFNSNLAAVWDLLTKTHGFELSEDDDKEGITKVFKAFFDGGPLMNYQVNRNPSASISYLSLMTSSDLIGRQWSYLATEENFRILREYQKKNLIIPLVGDFAGPKTLRAVGQYATEHSTTIGVFYTSNVDEYLFQDNGQAKFLANVATFPLNPTSMIIRMNGGPSASSTARSRFYPINSGPDWSALCRNSSKHSMLVK
jgi:hypothetical protein